MSTPEGRVRNRASRAVSPIKRPRRFPGRLNASRKAFLQRSLRFRFAPAMPAKKYGRSGKHELPIQVHGKRRRRLNQNFGETWDGLFNVVHSNRKRSEQDLVIAYLYFGAIWTVRKQSYGLPTNFYSPSAPGSPDMWPGREPAVN